MTASAKMVFVSIFVLLALAMWAASMVGTQAGSMPSIHLPAPLVTVPALDMDASPHANSKHGWLTAQSIVDCISKNGTHMNLKFKDRDGKFYLPCQLPDGNIGLGIFDAKGNNITAFVPRDGTWEQVKEYILQRATRFTGALPWQ
jgi:putative hemolysin